MNVVNFFFRRDLQRGNTSANGEEDEANRQDQASEDDSVEVTPLMVVAFVVLICGTLLLLYYFYDYLVYVVIVLFCLASCNGLYECLHPIVLWLPLGMCRLLSVAFYVINNRSYENVSRQFSQKKNCQGVPPYFKPQIQSCPWVVSYSTIYYIQPIFDLLEDQWQPTLFDHHSLGLPTKANLLIERKCMCTVHQLSQSGHHCKANTSLGRAGLHG